LSRREDPLASLARFRASQREFHDPVAATATCARGCASCCSQMVFDVAAVEVEDLGLHLRRTGREEEVLPRLRARRALYDRTRLENPRRPGESTDAWTERVARAFWAEDVPCAFLDADGACSVHDHRPQSCRRFFVDGPASLCTAAGCDDPRRRARMVEPGVEGEVDRFLADLDRNAPFDPEDDRLDHALLRWLRSRSAT
jgi:Fe-S-cluster containining protein